MLCDKQLPVGDFGFFLDSRPEALGLLSNDGSVARRWAEQGLGLVLRSQWDVRDAVASGSLVRVLADWSFDSAPILLLVPSRKLRSPRVQALVAFLEDALKA